jgi:hypothetical protein
MQKYKALGINIKRKSAKMQQVEVNTIEDDKEEN